MKVNSIMVVMAVAIASATPGCCWLCSETCPKEKAGCCTKQCSVGVNANVGDASAGAGMSTSGVHAEAKLGQ